MLGILTGSNEGKPLTTNEYLVAHIEPSTVLYAVLEGGEERDIHWK